MKGKKKKDLKIIYFNYIKKTFKEKRQKDFCPRATVPLSGHIYSLCMTWVGSVDGLPVVCFLILSYASQTSNNEQLLP